jgi:hypothetical protein
LIDATTSDWSKTLAGAAAFRTKFEGAEVPGHGDVGTLEDMAAFAGYLSDLRGWVNAAEAQKKSGDELVATVLPEVKKKYGEWEFFDYFAKANIEDTEAELRGTKRKMPG